MKQLLSALLCLFSLVCTAGAQGAGTQDAAAKPSEAKPFVTTDGYPLDTCVVTGEDLDAKSKIFSVEGHTLKVCCRKCQGKAEKDPKKLIAEKEAAVIKAQSDQYALATCPVSGKTLNEKAVSVVVDNTLVKLCCNGCKDKLTASAPAMVAKVQAAAFAKQNSAYTSKVCVVSGHEIDADAVNVMHGNTLIKLCCDDCIDKVKATPNAFAAKLAPAKKSAPGTEAADKGGAHGKQAAMANQAATGDCCEASCSSTCESGATKTTEKTGECCQSAKTGAEAKKTECCESAKGEAAKKTECCEDAAKAEAAPKKVEVKADVKDVKKAN